MDRPHRRVASAVAASCCALVAAVSGPERAHAVPSITITRVPPVDPGGTSRLATIEGRVVGARPGDRVVLYARSGAWYVQPFADRPFTAVGVDGTWTSQTHLGTEYAALLVGPGFEPAVIAASLPVPGPGLAGIAALEVTAGEAPFWHTRWFQLGVLAAIVTGGATLHRVRVRDLTRQLHLRAEERLAERARIAQQLYDTLLQGFLGASMQLHMAVDDLPSDHPQRPRLVGALRTMGEVVEEGRQVLRGLCATGMEVETLDAALARLPRELEGHDVEFHVCVEGTARALHPIIREEVYRVGREAVVNALRHARARAIGVEIRYAPRALRLKVRDDGCGIDYEPADDRTAGTGMSSMRGRAESIGARLRVRSRRGRGTEVDLSVPAAIAYATASGGREMGES